MPQGLKEDFSEGLKESRENMIGSQRKGNPTYVVVESLATLSPVVIWKIGNVPNKLDALSKEISG